MQDLQEPRAGEIVNAGAAQASRALLGSGVVVVWNDVAPEGRQQFYDWHDKEHIPERLAIPGFRRGRRYARPGHSPEWLTVYEAADLSVLVSHAYLQRLNAPTPLTVSTLRHFRNTSRAVCRVVTSTGASSGGYMLSLRLEVPAAHAAPFRDIVDTRVFPSAMGLTGIVACHLCAADPQASLTSTAESKTRDFDVPAWVLLIEASRPEAAERVRDMVISSDLQDLAVAIRRDGAVYSLEICRLATERRGMPDGES